MSIIDTRPATRVMEQGVDATRDDVAFERYESTATEPNLAPLAFDERIDLETRVYAVLLGAMSFGGVGWICLCAGAGLNFLFS